MRSHLVLLYNNKFNAKRKRVHARLNHEQLIVDACYKTILHSYHFAFFAEDLDVIVSKVILDPHVQRGQSLGAIMKMEVKFARMKRSAGNFSKLQLKLLHCPSG